MYDIEIVTFGVKHRSSSNKKTWPRADLYFDCQVMQNPPPEFYSHNGTEAVLQKLFKEDILLSKKLQRFWDDLVAHATKASAQEATPEQPVKRIALYCFGGRHRSVGVSEILRETLASKNIRARVEHLDIHKTGLLSHAQVRRPHGVH